MTRTLDRPDIYFKQMREKNGGGTPRAGEFAKNDYSIKWLFATIAVTDAYQRRARVRRSLDETPFVANSPQPLRANQWSIG